MRSPMASSASATPSRVPAVRPTMTSSRPDSGKAAVENHHFFVNEQRGRRHAANRRHRSVASSNLALRPAHRQHDVNLRRDMRDAAGLANAVD
jgi:hypothetical protein